MGYDDILCEIGEFGRYQKLIFLLVSICSLFAPLNVVSQVFLAGESDHWCRVEESTLWQMPTNCSDPCARDDACNSSQEWTKELTIPLTDEGGYAQCSRYGVVPADECGSLPERINITQPCDAGWEYDRSQYKSTIITDFDLVCGRENWPNVAQTVYFGGILIGSLVFGSISDRYGRRFGMLATLLGTAVCGVLVSLSQSVTMYIVTRFFLGATAHNTFLTAFVVVSELVGPSKRVLTGMMIEYFFALGMVLLPILAYFVRHWRALQLMITLPGILMAMCLFVIPESPRWLISKKRWKEAYQIIKKTAQFNGKDLTEEAAQRMSEEEKEDTKADDCSLLLLLTVPNMRLRTLSLLFNWCVQSFVYYGLVFSTPSLGVNIYMAFIISGAVEVVGYTLAIFLIERYGRRPSLSGLLATVGVSCLLVLVTPGISKFIFGMIGKAAISGTFGIIFV